MRSWHPKRLALFLFFLFAGLSALLAALSFIMAGGESEAGFLFGLSLARLLLAGLLLLLAGIFTWAAIDTALDPSIERKLWMLGFDSTSTWGRLLPALGLIVLGWVLAGLPSGPLDASLHAYLVRLRPLFYWLMGMGFGALSYFIAFPSTSNSEDRQPLSERVLRLSGLLFSLFLMGWILVWLTGLGLGKREDYWYGAGVPVLPLQVLASLAAGLLITHLDRSGRKPRGLDTILFISVWALCGIWWAVEPIRTSFFLPGPFRPTQDFYPFSDGILFDIGGQYALIGQGILNGAIYDRVLYMAFSSYLHALFGQSFITVMAVQAAVYAVLPALMYLMGKELHSRGLGIAAAALTGFRGVNAIAASTWIDLASPKMTMTDFPTGIGVVLFSLLLIHWLANPARGQRCAMWAGAALGLSLMLRAHVLLLLPAGAGIALLAQRVRWRAWLPGVLLLVLGTFAVTTPWDLRNHSRGEPLFDIYFRSIRIMLEKRYLGTPTDARVPPAYGMVSIGDAKSASIHISDNLVDWSSESCDGTPCRVINHFLHNITTSIMFLPTSPGFDGLRDTVKTVLPYWQQEWRGEGFKPVWGLFLTMNLALLALGIATAWERLKWVGLVPLASYLAYFTSNALAMTSGGRYIVPVDWVILLYYLLGALAVCTWAMERLGWESFSSIDGSLEPAEKEGPEMRGRWPQVITNLFLIFAAGSLVVLPEYIFPLRYASAPDPTHAVGWMKEQGIFDQAGSTLADAGLDEGAVQDFLRQPGAGVWIGRALYPRHYETDRGETSGDFPFNIETYPRMAFILIGPDEQLGVILPGEVRRQFENASDVLVLGCYTENRQGFAGGRIDALAVFLTQGPGLVFFRSSPTRLECPLAEPVSP